MAHDLMHRIGSNAVIVVEDEHEFNSKHSQLTDDDVGEIVYAGQLRRAQQALGCRTSRRFTGAYGGNQIAQKLDKFVIALI